MSLKDVLSPFKEYSARYREYKNNLDDDERCYEIKLKTEEFEVETTYGNAVKFSKPHIDDLLEKYKDYRHNDLKPLHITAELYFYSKSVNIFADGKIPIYKKLIAIEMDNRVFSNVQFYNKNFKIKINDLKIIIHISYDFLFDSHNFDEEEHEVDLVFNEAINTINEEECVVCFTNKPNIIYTDCYHFCVCSDCDKEAKLISCPLCRKRIKSNKIKI